MDKKPFVIHQTFKQKELYVISQNEFGESMLNLQVKFKDGFMGRTAISYWDVFYLDYYEKNSEGYEEIMIQTSNLRIFIEGYGLKKIYEAITRRQLTMLDMCNEPVENPKDYDVYIRSIVSFERNQDRNQPAS